MIYSKKEFVVKDNLKVVLKTPEINEADKLLSLINDLCGQTDFLLSSPEDRSTSVEDEQKWLKDNIEGKDYLIVAYVDSKMIGDCSLNFFRHIKDKHRCCIGIAIDQAYWGKGIGSLMFDEMINIASNTPGIEQIELDFVEGNDRAKHLYETKGFKVTGSIPRAIKQKDGTYFDEYHMVKFL